MQGPPVVFISFKLKTPAWSRGEQPRPERQHVGKKTKQKFSRNAMERVTPPCPFARRSVFVYFILRTALDSAQITPFFFSFFFLC